MVFDDVRIDVPTPDDVPGIFEIYSDPRVWEHFPSGRMTEIEQAERLVRYWSVGWAEDGLSSWIVRDAKDSRVLGNVGCSARRSAFWNLGYRLAYDAHGRGIASRIAAHAIDEAARTNPEFPVVAYLLEHNRASARVAEKAGLSLRYRAPDAGNPDPHAVRLVYANRALTAGELESTLQ